MLRGDISNIPAPYVIIDERVLKKNSEKAYKFLVRLFKGYNVIVWKKKRKSLFRRKKLKENDLVLGKILESSLEEVAKFVRKVKGIIYTSDVEVFKYLDSSFIIFSDKLDFSKIVYK